MTTALSQLMSKRGLVPIQIKADIKIRDVGQHNIIVLLLNNAPKYYRMYGNNVSWGKQKIIGLTK